MPREGALGHISCCSPGKWLITCLRFKGLGHLGIQNESKSASKGDMSFLECSTVEWPGYYRYLCLCHFPSFDN